MKSFPVSPSPSASGPQAVWLAVFVGLMPLAVALAFVLSPRSIYRALPDAVLKTALSDENLPETPIAPVQIASSNDATGS